MAHWEFFSSRLGRRIVAANSLEFDHHVTIECDPDVASYDVQVKATAKLDRQRRDIIFSSKAVYRKSLVPVVNTVRFAGQISLPVVLDQLVVQRAWAAANNCELRILTEAEIRGSVVFLENCHAILPWTHPIHHVDAQAKASVMGTIVCCDHAITLNEVSAASKYPIESVIPVVASEYIDGRVELPDFRSKKFGRLSLVRRIFNGVVSK